MDGANRDWALEKEFRDFRFSPKGSAPYFDALWVTYSFLLKYDLREMPKRTFLLVRGNLYLAGLHFNILPEQKKFHEYAVWFMDNRLKNTGMDGYTKSEMSELYDPQKNRRR